MQEQIEPGLTGFVWFAWAIILFLIVVAMAVILKKMKRNEYSQVLQLTPMEVLERRYALGEINYAEYEKMKQELENQ